MNSTNTAIAPRTGLAREHRVFTFQAMACPCEIHVRGASSSEFDKLALLAVAETRRIEHKFSRYKDESIVSVINRSGGQPVTVDAETLQLLHYAADCYSLSDGLFDITSGILRQAWRFDGGEVRPDTDLISALLQKVGWSKVGLDEHSVTLAPGMEIDLGGIGKEYAVDRVTELLVQATAHPVMVNFGGDIRVSGAIGNEAPWIIGVADPDLPDKAAGEIKLTNGAVTTSGESYRYCFVDGKKLGHILNPCTGWPVEDAPRSVTVVAGFCLEAGVLSTLAMLQGSQAKAFLADQGVESYCF